MPFYLAAWWRPSLRWWCQSCFAKDLLSHIGDLVFLGGALLSSGGTRISGSIPVVSFGAAEASLGSAPVFHDCGRVFFDGTLVSLSFAPSIT